MRGVVTPIEFRGVRYTMSELSRMVGLSTQLIGWRLRNGWPIEQALGRPTPKQRQAGVASNLAGFTGTGAGSTAQDRVDLSFQKKQ